MEKSWKRKIGEPTGDTPGKPEQKAVRSEDSKFNSRKILFEDAKRIGKVFIFTILCMDLAV